MWIAAIPAARRASEPPVISFPRGGRVALTATTTVPVPAGAQGGNFCSQ